MVGSDGQHQQKMTCEMAGFEHHFNVDIKKLIREDYVLLRSAKPAPLGEKVAAALKGKKGKKETPAATPVATPVAGPRKGSAAVARSAAPTPASAAKKTGVTPSDREKKGELPSPRSQVGHPRARQRSSEPLRKPTEELVGRVRSLRFFRSVRDLQQMVSTDDVPCLVCSAESGAPAKGGKRKGGDICKPRLRAACCPPAATSGASTASGGTPPTPSAEFLGASAPPGSAPSSTPSLSARSASPSAATPPSSPR